MSDLCRRCGGSGREPNWHDEAERLRSIREGARVSAREISRRARVSPAYVSDIELGRRNPHSGDGARRVVEEIEKLEAKP